MDIILPLGNGSLHDNIELRFCMRSIEKHLKGIDNIYIVGEQPTWLQNVIHIPFKEMIYSENKQRNIYNKIIEVGAYAPVLSEDFLFFNDDHFILQDIQANKFPVHHKGPMTLEGRQPHEAYYKTLKNTLKLLPNTLNYDTHCPIIYNKLNFAMMAVKWLPFGYCLKTLYCNIYDIPGQYCEDMKIKFKQSYQEIKEMLINRLYFSIGNGAFAGPIVKVLNELYPEKSKFEI